MTLPLNASAVSSSAIPSATSSVAVIPAAAPTTSPSQAVAAISNTSAANALRVSVILPIAVFVSALVFA